jgi:hypothetical protein
VPLVLKQKSSGTAQMMDFLWRVPLVPFVPLRKGTGEGWSVPSYEPIPLYTTTNGTMALHMDFSHRKPQKSNGTRAALNGTHYRHRFCHLNRNETVTVSIDNNS